MRKHLGSLVWFALLWSDLVSWFWQLPFKCKCANTSLWFAQLWFGFYASIFSRYDSVVVTWPVFQIPCVDEIALLQARHMCSELLIHHFGISANSLQFWHNTNNRSHHHLIHVVQRVSVGDFFLVSYELTNCIISDYEVCNQTQLQSTSSTRS